MDTNDNHSHLKINLVKEKRYHMSEKQSKNFFVLEQEDCENYLTATETRSNGSFKKKYMPIDILMERICEKNIM